MSEPEGVTVGASGFELVSVLSDAVQNQLEFGGPVDEALASTDGHHFARVPAWPAQGEAPAEPEGLRLKTLKELEAEHVAFAIGFYGWNITRTAAALNIDRRTMHRKLDELQLRRPARVDLVVDESEVSDLVEAGEHVLAQGVPAATASGYTFREAPLPELVSEHPGALLKNVFTEEEATELLESSATVTRQPYRLEDFGGKS